MQNIHKNEDERCISREANIAGVVIYARRISEYMEGKCDGGFKK